MKNIGIFAHVDAGKTTTTENFLFVSGSIKEIGSVDNGTTITDKLDIEKQRGISVKSSSVSINWNNEKINIIDTPGHVDFSAEVERTINVIDTAIILISAVDGIQSHTYSIWELLHSNNIPTIFFINKIDRAGSDIINCIESIKKEFNCDILPLNSALNEGEDDVILQNISEIDNNNDYNKIKTIAFECLSEHNEEFFEKYLGDEEISQEYFEELTQEIIKNKKAYPLFCGSAKLSLGIENLLNAINSFDVEYKKDGPASALVYKIEHDKSLGRLAHIKLLSGSLKNRDTILNVSKNTEEKISQIKQLKLNKLVDAGEVFAGDIAVISGLADINNGDILGFDNIKKLDKGIQEPVLNIQVKAKKEEEYFKLAEALQILNIEDPALDFRWYKQEKELQLKLMGAMQMQILENIILNRFGIESEFSEPKVILKETPKQKAEGYIEYTLPKPCWAVMRFTVEPLETGSGVVYESKVGVSKIAKKYQNEVEQSIKKSLEQGLFAWEVTDLKITLIGGEDHEIHSRPGDFILATPMGIMRAIEKAGCDYLEPYLRFEISANEEFLGKVANYLTTLRAEIESPRFENDKFILGGLVPVQTSLQMSIRLNSITEGSFKMRTSFHSYKKCSNEHAYDNDYKGVNPLDSSQWILHQRGAYKADDRRM